MVSGGNPTSLNVANGNGATSGDNNFDRVPNASTSFTFSKRLNPVVPPFSMEASRYNMDSYFGRLVYYFNLINPVLMFETKKSLKPHIEAIELARAKKLPKGKYTDEQLWESRMKVESCVHPTTKEVIPSLFRMAAFVPVNFALVPFMLMPSVIRSFPMTIGIHTINQSYNALINYCNRSSEAQPAEMILKSYLLAVAVSLTFALGGSVLLRRLPHDSPMATVVRGTVPLCAVASAGIANVALMRVNEWYGEGVIVRDEDGNALGHSRVAGLVSLKECATARVLWNIPTMAIPPLFSRPICKVFTKSNPMFVEGFLIMLGLCLGVPPALAVFPAVEKLPAEKLEEKFHNLKRTNGEPVKTINFLKGL